jgi:phosphoserine aminotransferase
VFLWSGLESLLTVKSVYIAGLVLKNSLSTFSDKVKGQQAVANQKANIIYEALERNPAVYKVFL